jgi:hypothetical protein
MADLTLRLEKGSELTFAEIDNNFLNLDSDIQKYRDDLDSVSGTIQSVDSNIADQINSIVDSGYVNNLVDFEYYTDSDVYSLVDSSYIQQRQEDIYRDSAFITELIDSAHVRLHVKTDQNLGTDDDVEFQHINMTHASGALSFEVKNNSGSQLTRGTVVYISGISGTVPEVAAAANTLASTMPAFGILYDTIPNGNTGHCITFGSSPHIDTSAFTQGETLYVGETPGTLTNEIPSGTRLIQNIGTAQRIHANNGIVKVGGAGRTNATPNLQAGEIFYGSDSNYSVPTTLTDIVDSGYLSSYITNGFLDSINVGKNLLSTDSLAEGSNNLYYTESRWNAVYDKRTTDSLSEGGANLYYTDTRVRDAISAGNGISYSSGTGAFTVAGNTNLSQDADGLSLVANPTGLTNVGTNKVTLGDWVIEVSGSKLMFKHNGVDKFSIADDGEVTSVGVFTPSGTP